MTLSTMIYIKDEIDPEGVFMFCQSLLTKYNERDGGPLRAEDMNWEKKEGWREDGGWMFINCPGQDLPAWLIVNYRPDGGPLVTEEQAAEHNEDCAEATGSCLVYHRTACWLNVDIDTAYGYRDSLGRGCGDLHAAFIGDLGQWLDGAGVAWSWLNEFTGEVHTGYQNLVGLMTGGFEATAWFHTSVLPAIINSIEEGKNG